MGILKSSGFGYIYGTGILFSVYLFYNPISGVYSGMSGQEIDQ
jgi:hypothetical protein